MGTGKGIGALYGGQGLMEVGNEAGSYMEVGGGDRAVCVFRGA